MEQDDHLTPAVDEGGPHCMWCGGAHALEECDRAASRWAGGSVRAPSSDVSRSDARRAGAESAYVPLPSNALIDADPAAAREQLKAARVELAAIRRQHEADARALTHEREQLRRAQLELEEAAERHAQRADRLQREREQFAAYENDRRAQLAQQRAWVEEQVHSRPTGD